MTKVLYDSTNLHMNIKGHAGAGVKGEDLVCAGASTLASTLVCVAQNSPEYRPDVQVSDAEIDVRLHPDEDDVRDCMVSMDTVFIGFAMMAVQFPDYVSVTLIEEEDNAERN